MATSVKKKKTESKSRPRKTTAAKPVAAKKEEHTSDKRPIWEVIAEIGAQIPAEEWAKVPKDGSINYRHYLYGAPKRK